MVSDILNALHKARQETIKHECSEKLRRALKAKVRTHTDTRYFQGEDIFYKDEDVKRWKAGRVIGQDGSKVLIKIPTGLISVHSSRVSLTSEEEQNRRIAEVTDEGSVQKQPVPLIPHPSDMTSGSFNNSFGEVGEIQNNAAGGNLAQIHEHYYTAGV